MPAIVVFQNARMRGIGHVKSALLVCADTQRAGKMALHRAMPGLQERSVREEDENVAALRVSDIDGAAGVHSDPRRVAHTRVLKGKQGSTVRLKFVDEVRARIHEKDVIQRIGREGHRRIEFTWALSFVAPGAEKFKWRRSLRLRRGIHAVTARNQEKYGHKRSVREVPSHRNGNCIRHAANLRAKIV